ncbi:MAG: ABC transporter substrate-binding protein [Gammaproteobacteria bacterium]|nr:ABC transporter substrate-binding protein [Gammaproteobacteria bacterium]
MILLVVVEQAYTQTASTTVKVGVLKYGTVNWELDVLTSHELDKKNGVNIEIVELGNKNATTIALQGGEVNAIVSDWIWVSRQRAAGKTYTFFPYSNAVGGMLVRPDADIKSFADLKGKRLGIAGGPVDKNWLIYRAYIRKQFGFDPMDEADTQFAAPPLLNELMMKGDLDAVITFWVFGARLQAAGMRPMVSVPEILPELGVDTSMPLLGWVFDEQWAEHNPAAVEGLIRSTYAAKEILLESDAEWTRLSSLIRPESEDELHTIRDVWRAGVPGRFDDADLEGAALIFSILAEAGGKKLVGDSPVLAEGTFWRRSGVKP